MFIFHSSRDIPLILSRLAILNQIFNFQKKKKLIAININVLLRTFTFMRANRTLITLPFFFILEEKSY